MFGMKLRDPLSGLAGEVDAVTVMADGRSLARIADRWFFADMLVQPEI